MRANVLNSCQHDIDRRKKKLHKQLKDLQNHKEYALNKQAVMYGYGEQKCKAYRTCSIDACALRIAHTFSNRSFYCCPSFILKRKTNLAEHHTNPINCVRQINETQWHIRFVCGLHYDSSNVPCILILDRFLLARIENHLCLVENRPVKRIQKAQ